MALYIMYIRQLPVFQILTSFSHISLFQLIHMTRLDSKIKWQPLTRIWTLDIWVCSPTALTLSRSWELYTCLWKSLYLWNQYFKKKIFTNYIALSDNLWINHFGRKPYLELFFLSFAWIKAHIILKQTSGKRLVPSLVNKP